MRAILNRRNRRYWNKNVITLISDQTPIDQHSWTFRLPIGKSIKINWGNGDIDTIEGNGANNVIAISEYTETGTYTIKISGDLDTIKTLHISNETNLSGHLQISLMIELTDLFLRNINITITANEIGGLDKLTYLFLRNINITITANEIGGLDELTSLYLNNIPGVTITANEIGGLDKLTSLSLNNIPGATIIANEIGGLDKLTYLYLGNINTTIGASEIGGLISLNYLYLRNINATVNAGEIGGLDDLTSLSLQTLLSVAISDIEDFTNINITMTNSNMTTASIDNTIMRLYALAFAAGTWTPRVITLVLDPPGNNSARSSASDTAIIWLRNNGWTITVKE